MSPQLLPPWAALLGLLIVLPCQAQTYSVEFSVTMDSSVDPGLIYTNYHQGENPGTDISALGFEIQLTDVNGNPLSVNPLASFCTELEEPIGLQSYSGFDIVPLENAAGGRAGEAGTASVGIPDGGIGAIRAGQVRYLFDNYYQAMLLEDWDNSGVSQTQAFQLALWEITHDSDLDLSSTSGVIYIGAQETQAATDVVVQAQAWLDDIAAAGIDENYQSQIYSVWTAVDLDNLGATGNQDVLTATLIGSEEDNLITLATVPEPKSGLLMLLGGLMILWWKW